MFPGSHKHGRPKEEQEEEHTYKTTECRNLLVLDGKLVVVSKQHLQSIAGIDFRYVVCLTLLLGCLAMAHSLKAARVWDRRTYPLS